MTADQTVEGTLPNCVAPALLDSDRRVAADVDCFQCGYNLRTLPATGVCPECASAVAGSLRGPELHWASPKWLRGVVSGINYLLLTYLLLFLAVAFLMLADGDTMGGMLGGLAGFGALMLAVFGVALLTAPDRLAPSDRQLDGWRQAARWGSAAACILLLATIVLVAVLQPRRVSLPISIPFAGFVLFGLVVSPLAVFRYLGLLVRRAQEKLLARLANGLALALLILGVFSLLHVLLVVFGSVLVLPPLGVLRAIVVCLSVVGYLACGLLGLHVLLRSLEVFTQAKSASEERAGLSNH